MNLPSAIIFINSDPINVTPDGYFVDGYSVSGDGYINDLTRKLFEKQLFINETMTLQEFNSRIDFDPNYPAIVRLQQYRILVICPDYRDKVNRQHADLVLFYAHGQVIVEKNRFGPPGRSLPAMQINIFELLRKF